MVADVSTPSPLAASPAHEFLHPFHRPANHWIARYVVVSFAVILRLAVGLGGFSGKGVEPMHGDFEAQRHWIEITSHLPITKWYFYDLQYWGLDYPPLTAYHSWLMGKIASSFLFNYTDEYRQWFALDSSRGNESESVITFMRTSVVISDVLLFIPSVIWFTRFVNGKLFKQSPIIQTLVATAILFSPGNVLIDHGHFQYNTVMLGFTLLSLIYLIDKQNYAMACICFVAAIGFKQMALYYAPMIFVYLVSVCLFPAHNGSLSKLFTSPMKVLQDFRLARFFVIAVSTFFAFAALVAPFIVAAVLESEDTTEGIDGTWKQRVGKQLGQILFRVFPVARGLFEDKVANFWCNINLVIKLKNLFSNSQLGLMALVLTLFSIAPACYLIMFPGDKVGTPVIEALDLINRIPKLPRKKGSKAGKASVRHSEVRQLALRNFMLLIWGLISTSLGFFLFSFQVHEKSILVPLLPISLLLSFLDVSTVSNAMWICNAASFSMFPLLKKDELVLQYFSMFILWNWLMGNLQFMWISEEEAKKYYKGLTFLKIFPLWRSRRSAKVRSFCLKTYLPKPLLQKCIIIGSYVAMAVWHYVELTVPAPDKYPDLWLIANCGISFACFGWFYLYSLWNMWSLCH